MSILISKMLPVSKYLPEGHALRSDGGVRLFNPTMVAHGEGYAAAFRIVSTQGARLIFACRLGPDFEPIEGTQVDLSTELAPHLKMELAHSKTWHADPRLFILNDRIYLAWNDGFHHLRDKIISFNNQFIIELDQVNLKPLSPLRKLLRNDGQFRTEKNWMLFDYKGVWYLVYAASPHQILRLRSIKGSELIWERAYITPNNPLYKKNYGEIRGGCQPVKYKDKYYHFSHSVFTSNEKLTYVATLYTFEANPPFRVISSCSIPLTLPSLTAEEMPNIPVLNTFAGKIDYVTGAVRRGDEWILSYGVDDKVGLIASVDCDVVDALLDLPNDAAPGVGIQSIVAAKLRYAARRALFISRMDPGSRSARKLRKLE